MFEQKLKTLLLTLILMIGVSSTAYADIYISMNGNDANDGKTQDTSVATLANAWSKATIQAKFDKKPVKISVLPGTYVGQFLQVSDNFPESKIRIIGVREKSKRPIFDGAGAVDTWLQLKQANGKKSNISVESLVITNYNTAISLEGNRDMPDLFNAGTVIKDNSFVKIGDAFTTLQLSTAAIRLVNSKHNIIKNNYFGEIKNKYDEKYQKNCSGIHPLYLAHFSNENEISSNTFVNVCSAAIKFRDRSDKNKVVMNRFSKILPYGKLTVGPAVEEWFCDKDARKDCTKKIGECPSTNNQLDRNDIGESTDKKLAVISSRTGESRSWCLKEDFSEPSFK